MRLVSTMLNHTVAMLQKPMMMKQAARPDRAPLRMEQQQR